MSGPVMHASITRRFNLGNYQSKDITIGISQVPLHATDAMIADMLKTGGRIVEAIDRQIEHELGPRNPAAFVEPEPVREPQPESDRVSVASGKAESWESPATADIPDESEVTIPYHSVFGTPVTIPTADLLIQPIEATDPATGGQGKQLKYLNTALTSAGFVDGDRHWASLAIIQAAFGGMARTSLKSLKDLTKGEAHVVADFFMSAGDESISQLKAAASALKGQLVIGEQYCDQHPFCEHKWQGKGCFAEEAVLV